MPAQRDRGTYGQFCPVAMAAEIVCTRWTALVLRELLSGSTRFNDLRRGLPSMSPTLLSKRLKELEKAGVVEAVRAPNRGVEYKLTEAGEELRPVVMSLGSWGQRWIESSISLKNLDPSLLMWDMRGASILARYRRGVARSISCFPRSRARKDRGGSSSTAETSISARSIQGSTWTSSSGARSEA